MLKNCENVTWKNFFFSGNGKKMREKRKKRYKKNSMNEFIYYDGWGTKYE